MRLDEPFPLPGEELQCGHCGRSMAVSYPPGVIDRLRARGKAFRTAPAAPPKRRLRNEAPEPRPRPEAKAPAPEASPSTDFGTPRQVRPADSTEPTSADKAKSLEARRPPRPPAQDEGKAAARARAKERERRAAESARARKPDPAPTPKRARTPKPQVEPPRAPRKKRPQRSRRSRIVRGLAVLGVAGGVAGAAGVGGAFWYYGQDLPTVDSLKAYEPATVTEIYDHDNQVIGEIYEQRRYVVQLADIPKHVQDAFVSAEDAAFWEHGGVDFFGILRAVGRNALKGKKAQGASTITQQVTRNFLLTRDKTFARKIKEVLLAWRIEDAYTKERILFLYLNEMYLGSQAYGVEAASRTYFNKHVQDISIAEAAILAGLPQRPSDYSPHRHFEKAKARQSYVLHQMVRNGYITQEQADEEKAREIHIEPRGNKFLEKAPHFTEAARRYLVERYGEERVLNEGLRAITTCDLDLQKEAQTAVTKGATWVDEQIGFRRMDIETLKTDDQIKAWVQEEEDKLRKRWAREQDAGGRTEVPETSVLEEGRVYDAVITKVEPSYATAQIGVHQVTLPIEWHSWVYMPNPKRNWRYRKQDDFTALVDGDEDGEKDGGMLRRGDLVQVELVTENTASGDNKKVFSDTPAATGGLGGRLRQTPKVESSLLSVDEESGAIRAMVGGVDFTRSQFNRATQAIRQVGSTFKPIVYATALESKKFTTASMVADARLAFNTSDPNFTWKPANYSNDYLGNITLRKALALSKNTCTIRVIDSLDPGMHDDLIYDFARRLGIGGQPTHLLTDGAKVSPDTDHLCPWIPETPRSRSCADRSPAIEPGVSLREHRARLDDNSEYRCRACDMSMGLGSASLTMEELLRAYMVFANGGTYIEPWFIKEVRDRDGNVLETHEPETPVKVMDPEIATLTTWLLEGVANGGTASKARRELGRTMAGKTGTTNDEKDAWFVGFTPDVLTTVWVGYDQPEPMGIGWTGGRAAMPIWIDYMKAAVADQSDRPFPVRGRIQWADIDEETGNVVTSGGVRYPFLAGTVPESSGVEAGQATLEELTTEL